MSAIHRDKLLLSLGCDCSHPITDGLSVSSHFCSPNDRPQAVLITVSLVFLHLFRAFLLVAVLGPSQDFSFMSPMWEVWTPRYDEYLSKFLDVPGCRLRQ